MRSNIKRAVRDPNQRAQYLDLSGRVTTRAFGDAASHGRDEEGSRHGRLGPTLQYPSGTGSTFSETRSEPFSDVISIHPSLSPSVEIIRQNDQSWHNADLSESNLQKALGGPTYSAQEAEDPVRRKTLHMPSLLLRSRNSTASFSQASTKAAASPLKSDKGRDETQILLTGTSKEMAVPLLRSMRLAYGGNYTKSDETAYRISILHNVVESMRDLLSVMKNTGIPFSEQSSVSYADTLDGPSESDWEFLPPALSTAMAALWKDSGVVDAYRRQDAVTRLDEME